ncbi:hypothetical protein CSUNSWCD_705 [Campylobacter showae CSUNSWCD]|uniref:Uncharacterized protein n=1 Tax=Campylobacter showae CSUNSWCD TaxID=1244083 RepID=M5IPI4_9BACT|nr:hypothetical protein CSUNSWCD_705 [Campylobacter showae CSUNSWCD]
MYVHDYVFHDFSFLRPLKFSFAASGRMMQSALWSRLL